MTISKLDTFRPWVQKIMPTVFDDSLSYYEALGKAISYMNQVNDQCNEIVDYLDSKFSANDTSFAQLRSDFIAFQTSVNNANTSFQATLNGDVSKLTQDFNVYQSNLNALYDQFTTNINNVVLPANVETILNTWYSNGKLASIINTDVFNMKADKSYVDSKLGGLGNAVTIESYGVVNDGSLTDWTTAQNAINDAVTNGKLLVFADKEYTWFKGLTIPLGKGGVVGQKGARFQPKTKWTFLHTDGSDCVTYGTGSGNWTPFFANIYILGSAQTGKGLYLEGPFSCPRIENIYIGATGQEGLYAKNVYLGHLVDVIAEKWDGKRSGYFESCGLIQLDSCNFNNTAGTTQEVLRLVKCNSVNGLGLNLNGQQGVYFENSNNCYLFGYHELGNGTPIASQSRYAGWFDSASKRNELKLQTVDSIVDLGIDNRWETTLLSNLFTPINPKKLVNNMKNGLFDTALDSGAAFTVASVIDGKPSKFSGNSAKLTIPTGVSDVFISVANGWVDNTYFKKLKAGNRYMIQFSIWGESDFPNILRNDSIYAEVLYTAYDTSHGINYAFVPIFKKSKMYQWTFTLPNSIVGDGSIATLEFHFTNNTGSPRTVWLGDFIFTDDIDTKMPDFLNALPTDGTWIAPSVFPKSNANGGFVCTVSGTYKTINTTNANTTAGDPHATLTTSNIADFAVGDFVDIGADGTFRITAIDVTNSILTLNMNVGHTASNATVTIHNPTFTSF